MPTYTYGLTIADILTNAVDIDTHAFQAMLCTNSYVPNYDTDHFVTTPRAAEVANGNGYTTNGIALTAGRLAVAYVTAATAPARTNSATYAVGQIVRPAVANGHVWRCIQAGTAGGSEPAAMTTFSGNPGQTVTDSGVVWAECGRGYVRIYDSGAGNVQWTSATITARYLVIYDNNPGTDATRQLLCCLDMRSGSDPSSTNGNFTVTFDTQGLLLIPIP